MKADLVFYETAAGGAVFSTGSIAWAGSLSHNGYDNNVSGSCATTCFLDPEPSSPGPPLPFSFPPRRRQDRPAGGALPRARPKT